MKPRTIGRWINLLFWIAVWLTVVWWIEDWRWVPVSAVGIIAALPWLFIHIALRTETPETSV